MSDALRTNAVPPSDHHECATSATTSAELTPSHARRSLSGAFRHVGARFVYWTPVFAALCLFAQVSFLGLRPAISEARRLADASDMLEARWTHDRGLYDAYELQLRVRQDPIFVERQRRLRLAVPAGPSSGI